MLDIDFFEALIPWYEAVKSANQPAVIYGMGDGCEKVLSLFEKYGISCDGIFASDNFVRSHEFAGHKVLTLSQMEEKFGDFTVVMAFGSSLPEIMQRVENIAQKHKLIFPDTPVIGEEFFTKDGFLHRFSDAHRVFSLLADEQSRIVFESVIAFKITGNITYLKQAFTSPDEAYENILKLSDDEIYADLGAYTGDTIEKFLSQTNGKYRRIYALEPNRKNFRKCVKNTLGLDNIQFYNSPAWSKNEVLNFSANAGRAAQVSDKGNEVFARSLDSVLAGGECTYIKYDVEGADARALQGSEKTISTYCPKICTALYHRAYDMLDIPLLLDSIKHGYKLYMRQYPYYPAWETNLFCVAPSFAQK